MISPSSAEPICDVNAQLAALVDPTHPKDAVWLARGTAVPDLGTVEAIRIAIPAGLLLTTSREKAARFAVDPSDDCLAMILGYPQPKSQILVTPAVVQACDSHGCVVIEMAATLPFVARAVEVARRHGDVRLLTLPEVMVRRLAMGA